MDVEELKTSVNRTMEALKNLALLNMPVDKVITCGWLTLKGEGVQWRMYVIDAKDSEGPTIPGIQKHQRCCVIGEGPPTDPGPMVVLFEFDNDDTNNSMQFRYPLTITEEDLAHRIFGYLVNNVIDRQVVTSTLQ